ncbi:hypothetical protein JHW43_009001 [Diplocarpon mali]|nr:hypothetical protein JHW43_009001 [Diplocarpon mali]
MCGCVDVCLCACVVDTDLAVWGQGLAAEADPQHEAARGPQHTAVSRHSTCFDMQRPLGAETRSLHGGRALCTHAPDRMSVAGSRQATHGGDPSPAISNPGTSQIKGIDQHGTATSPLRQTAGGYSSRHREQGTSDASSSDQAQGCFSTETS